MLPLKMPLPEQFLGLSAAPGFFDMPIRYSINKLEILFEDPASRGKK